MWNLVAYIEEHRLKVFENRALKRIFGPKRDGVTGEWRKLHNEALNDLYSSPNIVRVITARRMRWAGHVARTEKEVCTGFWWGNLWERDHWEDHDADGRAILRRIFRKWEGAVGTGSSWLRIGTVGGRLWVRYWTFGFHKMRGISWLAAKPVSFSKRTPLHGISKAWLHYVHKMQDY